METISIVAGFYAIGCRARRRLMENDPSPDIVQARDVSRLIDLPVLDLDVVEQALVVAPLRLHLDVQVEIDPALEFALHLGAGGGADGLDHRAAAADDDRLLRLPIDQDRAEDLRDSTLVALVELVHHDG